MQKHSSELSDSEEMIFEVSSSSERLELQLMDCPSSPKPSVGGSTQANSFTRVGIPRGFTAMRLPKSEAGVPTAELSGVCLHHGKRRVPLLTTDHRNDHVSRTVYMAC